MARMAAVMDEFKIIRAERTQARLRLALQAPSKGKFFIAEIKGKHAESKQ